jgi:hypothetical protein
MKLLDTTTITHWSSGTHAGLTINANTSQAWIPQKTTPYCQAKKYVMVPYPREELSEKHRTVFIMDRRSFVKNSATTIATLGASSTIVGAAASNETPTAKSEGIKQKTLNLRKTGKNEQLAHLLSSYDIPYALTKKQIHHDSDGITIVSASLHEGETIEEKTPDRFKKSSGDITTQSEFSRGPSNVSRHTELSDTTPHGDTIWYTDMEWDLNNSGNLDGNFESEAPDDGIQLSFSDNHWNHRDHLAHSDNRTTIDDVRATGLGAKFNDPASPPDDENDHPEQTGFVNTTAIKTDDKYSYTLYGTYRHAWSHLTASLSIQYGTVPFAFSVGSTTDFWDVIVNHEVYPDRQVTEQRRTP